jgi:hypothetical protein
MSNCLEYFVIGILAGICVIYSFQTRVKYPLWIVRIYDHPWILLLLVLLSFYTLQYNQTIGALLSLITCAFIVDGFIFTRTLKL